jgi:hypothetical protein
MIPRVIGAETSSPGEREIFERFKTDSGAADWVVLHSLDVPRHRRQVMGEIDFVIMMPGQGVLCLEVKSHRTVSRDADGLWHLGQDPPTRTGPFRQASEGMHSLREYVAERAPELRGILFWSAVCFTHVAFAITSPAEWHSWQVVDISALRARPLSESLSAVIVHARALVSSKPTGTWLSAPGAEPTSAQVDSIVRILRPGFEFFESPKSRRRQRDDELRRFTSEQFGALDAMDPEVNRRVVFEGPAGTGKTLLAIEETRRSTLRGEQVLLCCFNRLLGSWLRKEVEPFGNQVRCSTFHRLLLDVAGVSPPADASSAFWNGALPDAALEGVLSGRVEPFDIAIIDEAQDLLRDSYLNVLDALVAGGLREGRWRFFGDFEQQSIYRSSGAAIGDVLAVRAPGTPRYRLRKNCRNTPRIASFVTLLAAFERGYSEVLRADTGIEPEMLYYDSNAAQTAMLEELLARLYDEGYSGREIVILSPRVDAVAGQLKDPPWVDRVKPAETELPGGIRFCTVQAFKGLEAPVVIITDVTSVGTPDDHSLFYVAVTRATERLYVLASSVVKSAVLERLLMRPLPGSPT